MGQVFTLRQNPQDVFGAERYRESVLARQTLNSASKLLAKALVAPKSSKGGKVG